MHEHGVPVPKGAEPLVQLVEGEVLACLRKKMFVQFKVLLISKELQHFYYAAFGAKPFYKLGIFPN